jgi:hypothetical protein
MANAIAQAEDLGFDHLIMQCIYTDQIIVSPRPPKRPTGL